MRGVAEKLNPFSFEENNLVRFSYYVLGVNCFKNQVCLFTVIYYDLFLFKIFH